MTFKKFMEPLNSIKNDKRFSLMFEVLKGGRDDEEDYEEGDDPSTPKVSPPV